MCMFAKPVISVSDTQIFANMANSKWQNLVYQMSFKTKDLNAMILPLPVADQEEDAVEFVSLESYPDFFDDLNKGFPQLASKFGFGGGALLDSTKEDSKLKVHEVGNFVASFVPSLNDFDRLDEKFVIPKQTWDKIPTYANYGFAVYQLKQLEGNSHPMAFKFRTRLEERIFFPTVHIHDGEVHQLEDFDHTLYVQHRRLDRVAGKYRNATDVDPNTGWIRSQKFAKRFMDMKKAKEIVEKDILVHRRIMKGKLKNEDVILNLANITRKKKGSKLGSLLFGSFGWGTPLALPLLGMIKLIQRRNEIRTNDSQTDVSEPIDDSAEE